MAPLDPGQRPADWPTAGGLHRSAPRTLLVKGAPAAVASLGAVLAGGSAKAREEVAGRVSRALPLQGWPSLQENLSVSL